VITEPLDLSDLPLVDNHSHAGLYERRLQRVQTLNDLLGSDAHYRTSTYGSLIRQACTDLYGDESAWSSGVAAQYADGIEPAYTRMLRRLGVRAALWDFRRLGRNGWPTDLYPLIYWIDHLICPFPDASFWRGDEFTSALSEVKQRAGLTDLPQTLGDYLEFVEASLRGARSRIVGLKLLLGYQRSLAFQPSTFDAAGEVYSLLRRGEPAPYRVLQDFIARRLFRLSGELDLPLQIHASFGAPNSNIRLANNDPSLLQPLLSEPENRATRVVLLHGGYPFTSAAGALAWLYPNVYLDFSVLPTLFGRSLARWLEEWIELLPRNKLVFGSDASSPEEYYTAAMNGRRQLAAALNNLTQSGTLTRRDALDLAERIGARNAIDLYHLEGIA
jgi:predicted TIM-barrel fold metal-dependent hydrolase